MNKSLLKNAKFWSMVQESTGAPGTAALQSGKVLDMSGYDGVVWMMRVDAPAAGVSTGHIGLFHMHSDSTSTTDMVSCTGSAYAILSTATSTDVDEMLYVLDVYKPTKRYVSCYAYKDSTNGYRLDVYGIQYRNRVGAVTQSTELIYGVVDELLAVSPST